MITYQVQPQLADSLDPQSTLAAVAYEHETRPRFLLQPCKTKLFLNKSLWRQQNSKLHLWAGMLIISLCVSMWVHVCSTIQQRNNDYIKIHFQVHCRKFCDITTPYKIHFYLYTQNKYWHIALFKFSTSESSSACNMSVWEKMSGKCIFRDSIVHIAPHYGLDGPGIEFR